MFKDGWVCRACWKPNRPGDDRCYRCKSPREEQAVVEAGSRQHMAEAGWESANRLDAKVPFLSYFVAWPLRVAGAGGVVIGVLLFLSALANSDRPDMFGMDGQVAAGLLAAAFLLAGIGLFYVARSVMRRARWAYAVGGAVAILGALPRLFGIIRLPSGAETASLRGVYLALGWLYLAAGLVAVGLLVLSFMKPSDEDPAPPTG